MGIHTCRSTLVETAAIGSDPVIVEEWSFLFLSGRGRRVRRRSRSTFTGHSQRRRVSEYPVTLSLSLFTCCLVPLSSFTSFSISYMAQGSMRFTDESNSWPYWAFPYAWAGLLGQSISILAQPIHFKMKLKRLNLFYFFDKDSRGIFGLIVEKRF